ncbi:predicted protein [Nematostella vectensis]|uniref:Calponin-homology (CH) domain-containing protein n=1 Tax=Nematostella vectensis TaxID=45351 RepID=A7RTE6_NEMVE|nr:predicted protein [Nematostella vectensis]|eukprot:XP_001637317.1 predicted protein [Nematostella vectensis]
MSVQMRERTHSGGSSSSVKRSSINLRSSQYIAHEEKDWIEIQKNTFTNWCNEQIRESGIVITDLAIAFNDGVTIVYLVESVAEKKCKNCKMNPKFVQDKLENTTQALKLLENDGIQLVNIDNQDIVNGNLKLIMGLIWRLILHYQISSSASASGKQLLLLWLKNALPELKIGNVTTDWNSGIALAALINFCDPRLMTDWREMNPDNSIANVKKAMKCAEDNFRIPQILSPELFASPYVDELSMMTYLSFFTQPGSPGERKTLEIVNKSAPGIHVRNFNTDWNDGRVIVQYLEEQCPGMISENVDEMTPVERVEVAVTNAEEKLGVKKVVTAKEMTSPDVDELSVMAYMLSFQNCEKLRSHASSFTAEGTGIRRALRGRSSDFQVFGRRDLGIENARVEVQGPHGEKIPVTVKQTLDGLKCSWTPQTAGRHKVSITHVGEHLPDSPFYVDVLEDVSDTQVSGQGLKNAVILKPAEFIIRVHGSSEANVTATAEGPSNAVPVNIVRNRSDGSYVARFTPREVGEHRITVMVGATPLPGTPFVTKVGDPSKVIVTPAESMRSPVLGEPVKFEVDTTSAGLGELAIKCKGPTGGIPVDVRATARGKYQVSYLPNTPGDYVTHCTFNGEDVPESPLRSVAGDPDKIVAHGDGLYQVEVGSPGEFFITLHGAARGGLEVSGDGPNGHFPVELVESSRDNDTYTVRFMPQGVGIHKIHIRYNGRPVRGSPFLVKVSDASKVRLSKNVHTSGRGHVIRHEVDVPLEVPREAGEGELSATCVGPDMESVATSVTKERDGNHHIRFMPNRSGIYTLSVFYGGREVTNSPLRLRVGDPSSVRLRESVRQSTVYNTMTEVDVPIDVEDDVEEITAAVHGPNDQFVKSTLSKENDGLYHIRFMPEQPGRYTVDVLCEGYHIANSPLIMSIEDSKPVQVKLREFEKQETIRYRVRQEVDVPMEIPSQVTEVSAEVRGPSNEHVLSTFRKEPDGYHHLRFVPYSKGTYKVDVRCKGKSVEGSPFSMNVGDPSSTLVRLREADPIESQYMVSRELDIAMDIPDDHWEVTSEVRGPDEEIFPSSIGKGEEGCYHVKFIPNRPGTYKVHVRCDGEPVENSPFLIKVGEPEPVQVAHVRSEELFAERIIQNEVDLTVETTSGAEGGYFTANVTGPDESDVFVRYQNQLVEGAPFLVNVTEQTRAVMTIDRNEKFYQYSEVECPMDVPVGTHPNELNVQLYDPESKPMKYTVVRGRDSSQCFIRYCLVNERTEFNVDARKGGDGVLTATLSGVKHQSDVEIQERNDSHYNCHYTAPYAGAYILHVRWDGRDIKDSPYKVTIRDRQSDQVAVDGPLTRSDYVTYTNTVTTFTIRALEGSGPLYVRCAGPTQDCDVNVQDNQDGTYAIKVYPTEVGTHLVYVEWGGRSVEGSPFMFRVGQTGDPSKVRVYGPGIENGLRYNFKGHFLVDTKGAGPGTLKIRIHGPKGAFKVEMYRDTTKDRTIGVRYNPTEAGRYTVNIRWGDEPILGSPFEVNIVETQQELDQLNELQDNHVTNRRLSDTAHL